MLKGFEGTYSFGNHDGSEGSCQDREDVLSTMSSGVLYSSKFGEIGGCDNRRQVGRFYEQS